MQLRIGVFICLLVVAGVSLGGCATGGSSASGAGAASQQERNEAAWKRAESNGR